MSCPCQKKSKNQMDNWTVDALIRSAQQAVPSEGYVLDTDDPVINMLVRALNERSQYLNEVGLEHLISKLRAATNVFDLENKVNNLQQQFNNMTKFDYLVVNELPSKGVKGTIYLLRLTAFETVKNLYEEYIWVNDRYELLGSVEVGGPVEGPFITEDRLDDILSEGPKPVLDLWNGDVTGQKLYWADPYGGEGWNWVMDLNGKIAERITATVNGTKVTAAPSTRNEIDITNLVTQLISASGGGTVKSIYMNATTYNPDSNGRVSLGNWVKKVQIGTSVVQVGTTGQINLTTEIQKLIDDSVGDVSGGLAKVTLTETAANTIDKNTSHSTNSSGTVTIPRWVRGIKTNGGVYLPSSSTTTANAYGYLTLPNMCTKLAYGYGTPYPQIVFPNSTGVVNVSAAKVYYEAFPTTTTDANVASQLHTAHPLSNSSSEPGGAGTLAVTLRTGVTPQKCELWYGISSSPYFIKFSSGSAASNADIYCIQGTLQTGTTTTVQNAIINAFNNRYPAPPNGSLGIYVSTYSSGVSMSLLWYCGPKRKWGIVKATGDGAIY